MSEADFKGARLSGASLVRATLFRANLQRTSIDHADFRDADLRECRLNDIDDGAGALFSGATLSGIRAENLVLDTAVFYGTTWSGFRCSDCSFREVDLRAADMRGVVLDQAGHTHARTLTLS